MNLRTRPRPRFGSTLVELLIAGLLLAIMMATAIPTLNWITRERQTAQRRALAAFEAGNVMERLASIPYDELSSERAAAHDLSPAVKGQLPGALLKIDVADDVDSGPSRRIKVELRWDQGAGQPAAPVRLVTWVYRQGRNAP